MSAGSSGPSSDQWTTQIESAVDVSEAASAVVLGRIVGPPGNDDDRVGFAAPLDHDRDGAAPVLATPVAVIGRGVPEHEPDRRGDGRHGGDTDAKPTREPHHGDRREHGERRRRDHEVAVEEDRPRDRR